MKRRVPFQWGNANFNWSVEDPTQGKQYRSIYRVIGTNVWNDCALIFILLGKSDPNEYLNQYPEKKKQFVKLLCEVQGKKYSENKNLNKIKVSVQDVQLVAKETLNINIKIQL